MLHSMALSEFITPATNEVEGLKQIKKKGNKGFLKFL